MSSYYIYFIIINIFLLPKSSIIRSQLSEIKLVINGIGTQQLLNNSFQFNPSEVIVNGKLKSCLKTCYLDNDINYVTIKFNSEINSCVEMFSYLYNIIEVDLSNFDASKVEDMRGMFFGCHSLKKINLGNIDTSLVKSIHSIFADCFELTFVDLSKFKTDSLEDMMDTFASCHKLIAVNMNNFNTPKVTNMRGIFYNCYELKYADLSSFQTNYVTDVSYMFTDCRTLIYADLSNFRYQNSVDTLEQFNLIYPNTKICMKNSDSRNYYSGISLNDCNNNCFKKGFKLDLSQNNCIENCVKSTNNKFEYYNLCFTECPENTYSIINEYLCYDYNPEGYYLNNINKKYEPCYVTCKNCFGKGDETNNNCKECNNGYQFLNDPMFHNNNNCYSICNSYFYFDEFNNYQCTDVCPPKFDKIIIQKNKCIDECKKDDKYKYEYKKTCYENCPVGTYHIFNFQCIDEIITNQNLFLKFIQNNVINNVNIIELINGKDLTFNNGKVKYTITSTNNQKNNFDKRNTTAINLGYCGNELKEKYKGLIPKDEENFYLLKIDIPLEGMKIPKIEYEVYYPLYNQGLVKLDLFVCKDTEMLISIPINISNDKLEKHNASSGLYNDICYTLTSESGTDKSLEDRKKDFIDNNLTVCEEDCKFVDYNNETKKAICSCLVKIKLPIIDEVKIDTKLLISNFKDINNIGNFIMLKCIYLFLDKNNIFKNSSNYLFILLFILSFVTVFVFSFHGYLHLKKIIKKITKNNKKRDNVNELEKKQTNNESKKENKELKINVNNNSIKIKKRNKKKKKRKIKKNEERIPEIILINNNSDKNILNYNKNKKKEKAKENKKKKEDKQKKNENSKQINKMNSLIDAELNNLDYNDAANIDKRKYLEYYFSLIKTKHLLISSFFNTNDYNSRIIKIYLFFFTFTINYVVSAMFYTDETMHKIYVEAGSFNFIYQIPQMIYSSIITAILNFIITSLGLCQSNILQVKQLDEKNSKLNRKKVLKIIKCKIVFFFIITYILLFFFWIYLGCFCAVYKNTQIHLLKEVSSSFATSLITPLFIYLLPGILRIPALRDFKNNRYIMYKFSKILQIF